MRWRVDYHVWKRVPRFVRFSSFIIVINMGTIWTAEHFCLRTRKGRAIYAQPPKIKQKTKGTRPFRGYKRESGELTFLKYLLRNDGPTREKAFNFCPEHRSIGPLIGRAMISLLIALRMAVLMPSCERRAVLSVAWCVRVSRSCHCATTERRRLSPGRADTRARS